MCPDSNEMELERLQDQADREGVQLQEDEEIKANMRADDTVYTKTPLEETEYWAKRRVMEEKAEREAQVGEELAGIDAAVTAKVMELAPGELVTLAASEDGPECYVRVNVTQNTKGYTSERTVSLKWKNRVRLTVTEEDGEEHEHVDRWVVAEPVTEEGQLTGIADADPMGMLTDLLEQSRRLVKTEIAACAAEAKEAAAAAELAANEAMDRRAATT